MLSFITPSCMYLKSMANLALFWQFLYAMVPYNAVFNLLIIIDIFYEYGQNGSFLPKLV